jgi:uncharacterized membrane protein (DUF485 family)
MHHLPPSWQDHNKKLHPITSQVLRSSNMSSNLVYQKIRENPQYRTLVRSRSRLAFTLSAVVLGFYSLFIASVLWQPQLLTHVPPGSGSLTIGIWAALILVVGSWLLTGLYVLYANNQFDKLTEALLKGVRP